MDKVLLIKALKYPSQWLKYELLPDELINLQIIEVSKEYGNTMPKGGTEHWRFGAFLYWLKRDVKKELLPCLLEAAIADPDQPMAGSVIKEIIAHPLSSESMLEMAIKETSKSKYYGVSESDLRNQANIVI